MELVESVLNYFYTFVGEYDPQFLRANTANTLPDMMSPDFLHEMTSSTYIWYVRVRKVNVRHLRLLDVARVFNELFPSRLYLGVLALHDVVHRV